MKADSHSRSVALALQLGLARAYELCADLGVCLDHLRDRGPRRHVRKDGDLARVRWQVIQGMRSVTVNGQPISTPMIGRILNIHHSTVVLALHRDTSGLCITNSGFPIDAASGNGKL